MIFFIYTIIYTKKPTESKLFTFSLTDGRKLTKSKDMAIWTLEILTEKL